MKTLGASALGDRILAKTGSRHVAFFFFAMAQDAVRPDAVRSSGEPTATPGHHQFKWSCTDNGNSGFGQSWSESGLGAERGELEMDKTKLERPLERSLWRMCVLC